MRERSERNMLERLDRASWPASSLLAVDDAVLLQYDVPLRPGLQEVAVLPEDHPPLRRRLHGGEFVRTVALNVGR